MSILTSDSNCAGGYFFMRTKRTIGHFEGFFEGAKNFLTQDCRERLAGRGGGAVRAETW
jgi:hypothetical protein